MKEETLVELLERRFVTADGVIIWNEQVKGLIDKAMNNNRRQSARDWMEDFSHENGNYENNCIRCGNMFLGHKRRVTCKKCADGNPKFNNDNEKSE